MLKFEGKMQKHKLLSGIFIIVLTISYLFITSAFAQEDELEAPYQPDGKNLTFHRDYLSYGDLWAFDQETYDLSCYAEPTLEWSYYSNSKKTESTIETIQSSNYFGTISFDLDERSGVNGEKIKVIEYDSFNNANMVDSIEGEYGQKIPVLKTENQDEIGTYTVIPRSVSNVNDDTGKYRIYVYSESNPENLVKYHLIDSYIANNSFADKVSSGTTFSEGMDLKFTDAENGWWYAEISIQYNVWTGAYPSNVKDQGSAEKEDTLEGDTNIGSGMNTTLYGGGTTYYYNAWKCNKVSFNTLLVLQWTDNVCLGPITKEDSITIISDEDMSDEFTGVLSVTNIFGEKIIADGTAQTAVHAPLFVTPVVADEKSVFDGFSEELKPIGNDSVYMYTYEEAGTITGHWTKMEPLPKVTVSGNGYTATTDFYNMSEISTSYMAGTSLTYTLTPNFTNAEGSTITYTIAEPGKEEITGILEEPLLVDVKMDTVTISLTAISTSGVERSCVVTIESIADESLPYIAQNSITGIKYRYIEDAIMEAETGQTIVLIGDASFQTEEQGRKAVWKTDNAGYTIDSGVKLLLPYSDGDSGRKIRDGNDKFPYANYALNSDLDSDLNPETNVYLTLMVPEEITIQNNGHIVIGGTISGGTGVGYAGVCAGSHSNMVLNGTLNLDKNSILSVTGYLLGEGKIETLENDNSAPAKIYQMFSVLDFFGGGYTIMSSGNQSMAQAMDTVSGEDYLSPFTRYAMLNIQTDMVIKQGNYLYGYCDLYAGDQDNRTTAVLIGDNKTPGVIVLKTGSDVTVTYDETTYVEDYISGSRTVYYSQIGKTSLNFTGGASFGSMKLTLNVGVEGEVNTSALAFPVPYNYDIILEDGQYSIEYDMNLLPGAGLTVGQEAELIIGETQQTRFAVFDGLFDHRRSSAANVAHLSGTYRSYPSTQQLQADSFGGTASANFVVDGGIVTFGAKANFGGLIQTTGAGSLTIANGAAMGTNDSPMKVQFGAVGKGTVGIEILGFSSTYYASGASLFDLTARIIDPSTGNQVPLQAGKTYLPYEYSSVVPEYTYKLYSYTEDAGITFESYTDPLNAIVQGAWYESGTTIDSGITEDATAAVAKVVWADGADSTYYTSLEKAVLAAVHAGDEVVLLKNITMTRPIAVRPLESDPENKGITISLAEEAALEISADVTAFLNYGNLHLNMAGSSLVNTKETISPVIINYADADMTLSLNGGNINWKALGGTGSEVSAIVNYGNMELDTANGSITMTGETQFTVQSQCVLNEGTLSISGNGSIINEVNSSVGVTSAGTIINSISAVRNEGVLSLSEVMLQTTQKENHNSAGLINHMGQVLEIKNAEFSHMNGYGIYNLGGTIELIDGGSMSGYYGIYNQNIRSGVQDITAGNTGFEVTHEAKILEIQDIEINVTQYGLYNRATVGTIGGTASISAATYAIYNDYSWYYDAYISKYEVSTGSEYDTKGQNRTYYNGLEYDLEAATADLIIDGMIDEAVGIQLEIPTIARITDSVSITGTKTDANSYAIYNRGYIAEISGEVDITADYRYGLAIVDGGCVNVIKDNVSVYAANRYAIYVSGQLDTKRTEYRDEKFSSAKVYGTEYYSFQAAKLLHINGSTDGVGVSITAGENYGLQVNAEVGDIGGKVNISAAAYAVATGTNGAITYRKYERSWEGSVETARYNRYEYAAASIQNIGALESDTVLISTTGNYGIYNNGHVELIGPGTTITSAQYTVQNANDRREVLIEEITSQADQNVNGKFLTVYNRTYTQITPEISTIDGANISSTANGAIRNYGYIQTIKNAVIDAGSASYAIYNYTDGAYKGERRNLQYYLADAVFGTTTSQFATNINTLNQTKSKIDSIENCQLTAANYVIYNGGDVGRITGTTITATGNYAIYNIGKPRMQLEYGEGIPAFNSSTGKYECTLTAVSIYDSFSSIDTIGAGNIITANTNTVYNSGHIGSIDSGEGMKTLIQATAGVALYNYRGLANTYDYYSANIDTIKNVEIVGTSYAIKNGDGNASYTDVVIGELGEGVVAVATASNGYGVYDHVTNATITLISGGDYYSGAKKRTYAVYLPDEQKYPDGCTLSQDTEEAIANQNPYQCYYVASHVHTYGDIICEWSVDDETKLASVMAAVSCSKCTEGTEGHTLTATVNNIVGTEDAGDCKTLSSTIYTTQISLNGETHSVSHIVQGESYGEHSWDSGVVTTKPTCEGEGVRTYTCTICGNTKTEVVEAAGHDYNEPIFNWTEDYAECNAVYGCNNCDVSYEVECIVTSEVSKPATEKENGEKTHTAIVTINGNVYEDVKEEVLSALGHSFAEEITKEPTCTSEGEIKYTCACGETYTEVIAALGHKWSEWTTVDATCTTDGMKSRTCSVCGENETETWEAMGHSYLVEVIKQATCTEPGLKVFTCSVCRDSYEEVIAVIDHTVVVDAATAATCTEPGLTEGSHCSVCGTVLTAQEVIDAFGHIEVEDEGMEPTCTDAGLTAGSHCSVCGEVLITQQMIDALGHTETTVEGKTPTCTEPGLTEGTKCLVCGEVFEAQEEIPALGHKYDSENGTQCTECKKTPSIVEKGRTLSYENYIYVVDIFELKDVEGIDLSKDAGILVWRNSKPTVVSYNSDGVDINAGLQRYDQMGVENVEGSENFYYGVSDGIYTRNLHETLYIAGYVKLPNGQYVYSNLLTYSPSTYAYNMIEKYANSQDAPTYQLCVALLNYITAAQEYFNVGTEPANSKLTDAEKELVWTTEIQNNLARAPEIFVDISQSTIFTKTGQNLRFEDMISLGALYEVAPEIMNTATESYTIFWTAEQFEALKGTPGIDNFGEGIKVPMSKYKDTKNQWYSSAPKIAAKDMQETQYYFLGCIVTKDADGNEVVNYSGVLSYSIEEYIFKEKDNEKMGNFAKRLYHYERAAKAALKPENGREVQ